MQIAGTFDRGHNVRCPDCGTLFILEGVFDALTMGHYSESDRVKLGYSLRQMPRTGTRKIDKVFMDQVIQTTLPKPHELVDSLIFHLGKTLSGPGQVMTPNGRDLRTAIGTVDSTAALWTVKAAHDQSLLQGDVSASTGPSMSTWGIQNATLSHGGWARYNELLHQKIDSKRAFWASKWNEPELDSLFSGYLQPAVRATGFDLVRLSDIERAGLIDDRLRVEIRRSRFLVADLTHGNNGAYWEAGFAEGLGRPVIYTCRKDIFEAEKTRPHFDANHYLTVIWEAKDLASAAQRLKTVIRATLPEEAELEDESPQ